MGNVTSTSNDVQANCSDKKEDTFADEIKNAIIYEGYLEKYSSDLDKSKKQWIVLRGHYLYVYNHKQNKKIIETIDLTKFHSVRTSNTNKNKFYLISNKAAVTKTFIASSTDDANKWVSNIWNKLPRRLYTKTVSRKSINCVIPVKINIYSNENNGCSHINGNTFVIWALYTKQETIQNIFDTIKRKIYYALNPLTLSIYDNNSSDSNNKCLTDYNKNMLKTKGLNILVKREHICAVCSYNNVYKINTNGQIEKCNKCDTMIVSVPIKISQFSATLNNETFYIVISYTDATTIKDIIDKATQFINHKFQPKAYYIYYIKKESFCGGNIHESCKSEWNPLCETSVTKYKINEITQVGMEIYVSNAFRHIIDTNETSMNNITCEYVKDYIRNIKKQLNTKSILCKDLLQFDCDCPLFVKWCDENEYDSDAIKNDLSLIGNESDTKQSNIYQFIANTYINNYKYTFETINNIINKYTYIALKCPMLHAAKTQYDFSSNIWHHLRDFSHFSDEFNQKEKCRYGQKCKAFIRLNNGGSLQKDKFHNNIYLHPPRDDGEIKMKGMYCLIFNKNKEQNHPIYKPTDRDQKIYKYNETNGYLYALIDEVIRNHFKYDLCMNKLCRTTTNCTCNNYFGLVHIAKEKLNCYRHKQMGNPLRIDHMLALIMYTGCDCNYDLCRTQRNGNYKKWKWFDHILFKAICRLSIKEKGCYKLYSGLNKIKLNESRISNGHFVTYTSTSWQKRVAKRFAKGSGMIIEIDEQFRNNNKTQSCDISWISKFGSNECEVLIARSVSYVYNNNFTLDIVDETNGLQTVLLKKYPKK